MSARHTLLMGQSNRRHTGGPVTPSRSQGSSEPLVRLADDSDLPPYEPLQQPLNEVSVRAVQEIANRTSTTKAYEAHLERANALLREAIGVINDTYTERKAQLAERIEAREQRGRPIPTELELELTKAVERLSEPVPSLTKKIESGARTTIDQQMELEDERKALEWVARQLEARQGEDRHRRAQQEIAATNRRAARAERASRKRRREEEEGEDGEEKPDGEDGDEDEMDRTDDEDEGPPPISAVDALNAERKSCAEKYAAMSAYQKYALNNNYSVFKQTWHHAMYQDDDVPVPDASTWFDADGNPNDGTAGDAGAAAGGGDDSDEDLVVARETISLKCPLSLVTMTEPYKSDVCKHVFERTAIMEYLRSGPQKCPQTGCDKVLVKTQMSEDNIMRRRIIRAQKTQQRRNEAADTSDIEGDGVEDVENVVIDSQVDAVQSKREASRAESVARTVKRERFQRR